MVDIFGSYGQAVDILILYFIQCSWRLILNLIEADRSCRARRL